MKLSETRFPAFWDIYEPIFLTLESVQKTYFLSLITIHNIANPKIMVWQPVVFHNLQYQLLMTTLMYLSHAIDCQKECQNQQINHFKAINVSTIMQSCVDACGKAAKKDPTYLLKKKKIQSIPGSVIPTINILDNTSDTTCVELALMLAWWRGACGTTIGCKTSIICICSR